MGGKAGADFNSFSLIRCDITVVSQRTDAIDIRLSATRLHNSAASRTEPPFVRFEAIRHCIVPLVLHLSAKSLHIRSTSTLLFGTAEMAWCAASLGKSNRR
jgi:hypothetical protein